MSKKIITKLVFAMIIAILMLVGISKADVSRSGLVTEWHFDGDTKDSSGNGIDGTNQGAKTNRT